MRRRRTRINKVFRNPVWTPIGVFIAFTTLLVTIGLSNWFFRVPPPFPNRLMVSSETTKDLMEIPEPVASRLRLFVDGKEERYLRLFVFQVEYKGDQPLPNDFETPIIGRVPNGRKILAVQKSQNSQGPYRYDPKTEAVQRDTHSAVTFEASVIDAHTFEIKPLLMNAGEWFSVEIYSSSTDSNYAPPKDSVEKYKELSAEIAWSCHIANVQCPGEIDLERDLPYAGFDEPSFLQVSVQHQGWSVYFLLFFAILNLITLVLLAKSAGVANRATWLQLILFAGGTASSIASADVIADWLLPYRVFGIRLYDEQPIYAWIIFWSNILAMIILLIISVLRRKRLIYRRRPTEGPTIPNA